MPKGRKEKRSRSPSEVKRTQKKEKQAQKEKEARMFEREKESRSWQERYHESLYSITVRLRLESFRPKRLQWKQKMNKI